MAQRPNPPQTEKAMSDKFYLHPHEMPFYVVTHEMPFYVLAHEIAFASLATPRTHVAQASNRLGLRLSG